jgi:diguanylate cyclase (GGDEF)-like protein
LDILTSLMIWAVEATTLGALLLTRWLYDRENFYLSWGAGFCLHGLGFALIASRGAIPDLLSIEIAHMMVMSGMGLWVGGLMQFDRKPIEPFIFIPALLWMAGMLLTPVRENFANRIVLHNLAVMAAYAMLINQLVKPKQSFWSTRRVLAGLLSILFVSNAVAAALCLRFQPQSFEPASRTSWLFIPAAVVFVAGLLTAAKMLSDRTEQKLKLLAVTDPLTGVSNRRGLIDQFAVLRAVPNEEKPLIALLHFDLDNFKQVNDRCGHQGGDAVLRAFAEIAQSSLRGRGHFGRMGGEEFASILRVGDMIEAASISEAIRTTLKRQPISTGGHEVIVTVSTGIALALAGTADLDVLLTSADKALYRAKESGRDRTAIGGDEILIVPAIDHLQVDEVRLDLEAERQVATLKRLVAALPH